MLRLTLKPLEKIMNLKILKTAYHRNGICGTPFDVFLFEDEEGEKLGILFEREFHCAVFDLAKLAKRDIAFGSNSYRGDQFEDALRKAIKLN
jgi:hypothetical protein